MSSFESHGGVLLGILCLVWGHSLSAVYFIRLCRSSQHDCGSVFGGCVWCQFQLSSTVVFVGSSPEGIFFCVLSLILIYILY